MYLSGRPLLDTDADQRLFVGRVAELERVERSVAAGLNCLVIGPAGSGRTSLLRTLLYRADRAGRPWRAHFVRAAAARTAAELLALVVAAVHPVEDRLAPTGPIALLDLLATALATPDEPGPPVFVLDDVGGDAGAQLFGALRDEVWQLGASWLVSVGPAGALVLAGPPADAFFETRVDLGPLDGAEVADLLRRRMEPGDPEAAELIDAVLATRPDTPRRALEAARELVTAAGVGPTGFTVVQEHLARAAALDQLSRPARMLAQELESLGWSAASDARLLDRLGWTRTRVIQVMAELRERGLVQVREERTGRGRPRKLFRVVPPGEFAGPDPVASFPEESR